MNTNQRLYAKSQCYYDDDGTPLSVVPLAFTTLEALLNDERMDENVKVCILGTSIDRWPFFNKKTRLFFLNNRTEPHTQHTTAKTNTRRN